MAPDKAPVTGETPAATPPDKAPAAPAPTDKMPADTAPDAAPAAPAPTKISPGAKVYIQPNDFGMALTAAFLKKNVPVSVLTDSTKADFWVLTTSKAKEEKTAVKIVRFLGGAGSGDKFDATVTVLNRDGTVVFAYTSRKENSQSAAQNVAKNLKKQIEKK
ncbi:MAG TPA: hypothetical protein VGJ98_04420 [Candidatus Eisenbacteria bacterium]